MTAATIKSDKATALLVTDPRTLQDPKEQGAYVRQISDTVATVSTNLDETNDTILMLPFRSSDAIHSLVLFNDDLDTGGTSGAVNVGVYNGPDKFVTSAGTAYAAFAVIDADAFASAITTLTAVNTSGVEVRYESAANAGDIVKASMPIWEALGLPEDPNKVFLVGITVTTGMTTGASGDITLRALVS